MINNIIDGKLVAVQIKARVAEQVKDLKDKGINPALAVIIVGDDPASKIYVRNKENACSETGIASKVFHMNFSSPQVGQKELLDLINKLNNDSEISGILCQLPLPEGYDEKLITEAILPTKDVDAFNSCNIGKIMRGDYNMLPCTPAGIMEMLNYYNIDVTGKECVVVGRSNIVGKPMAMMLLNKNGTVTITHSKTIDLKEQCKKADILIAAVGIPKFITADMIKDGAVVIDVGINRVDGKLCGDVDFENVKDKCSFITPVPGGVGPMTVAMLMQNTVKAAQMQNT